MNFIATAAAITAAASTASAALISANGNATLISTDTPLDAGSSAIGAISDGNTALANNGQIFTTDRNGGTGDYFAAGGPIIVELDLGQAFDIDSISFWNRGNVNGNGVTSFNAVFSSDVTFATNNSSVYAFTTANTGGDQQDFALGTVLGGAQYVRIIIDDNGFGNGVGGDRVGFTEFQFNAVPEPSSTALLGLGGLALILRRRK